MHGALYSMFECVHVLVCECVMKVCLGMCRRLCPCVQYMSVFVCPHESLRLNISSMQQKKQKQNCAMCNGPWFPKGTNSSTVEM